MKKILVAALILPVLAVMAVSSVTRADNKENQQERGLKYLSSIPENQLKGGFGAVAKISLGKEAKLSDFKHEIAKIDSRQDTSDFNMAGLLRLLYMYGDDPRLSPEAKQAVTDTAINFKYWIDEPGTDSMCYWSENHQVLFHSAEYLAGALFPDRVFPNNGMTGKEHMEKGRALLKMWFSWRAQYGFSEWLSNVYYNEDIFPLLNLVDFAPDEDIRKQATMMLDQLALNMALNSYKGHFTCTHGRTYQKNVLYASGDDLTQVFYVWWGNRPLEDYVKELSKGGVAAATSSYVLPEAIYNIGVSDETMENFQVHGINADEAVARGMDLKDLNIGMFFWGQGMYTDYHVVDTTAAMWREWNLYKNSFFIGLAKPAVWLSKKGKLDDLFEKHEVASEGAILADTYTYTYRTADYILSSAQEKRKGLIDAQSFPWVAGMGGDAHVFTSYPGSLILPVALGPWTGNASNPRVAQYKNVAVIIYNAPLKVSIGESFRYPYTHAWFPKKAFDEVRREGKWTFARKGDGYLGLYAHNGVAWDRLGRFANKELISPGLKNLWICQMGRKAEDGSFDEFVAKVKDSAVSFEGLDVSYDSPSLGMVRFGWDGPFNVGGKDINLRKQMRYDNPYIKAKRYSERLDVEAGGASLLLDFETGERVMQ